MINPLSNSVSGLLAASRKLGESAARIAASPAPASTVNLDEELVTIKIAEQSYKANAQVLRTSRDMQDELLKAFDLTV
jgi:flagellar hook-associated protein FlgK